MQLSLSSKSNSPTSSGRLVWQETNSDTMSWLLQSVSMLCPRHTMIHSTRSASTASWLSRRTPRQQALKSPGWRGISDHLSSGWVAKYLPSCRILVTLKFYSSCYFDLLLSKLIPLQTLPATQGCSGPHRLPVELVGLCLGLEVAKSLPCRHRLGRAPRRFRCKSCTLLGPS